MAMQGCEWLCRSMYSYLGLCGAMYGYVWLYMAMYGYVGLCRVMQGYVGLGMAIYGYVWLSRAMYSYVGRKSYENKIKVVCTTKHAFTVQTESPRAFLACIRISYDDKSATHATPRRTVFTQRLVSGHVYVVNMAITS